MQAIIAFVSDFGTADTWVGVCHAVIYGACPQVRVVDLGHDVPPFDIRKGAATAAAGAYQLPDAIHLVAVDPGVGGGRDDLCLVSKSGTRFVGPDNGVLLPAVNRCGGIDAAFRIDPSKIDFSAPLATFHARDILAPTAAALACGVPPDALGERVDANGLVPAPFQEARVEGEYVSAEVLEADRFGSLRLSVAAEHVESMDLRSARLRVELGHRILELPFVSTFADVPAGDPLLLIDSSGWLTLALNMDSASERYGVEPGTVIRIRRP